MSHNSHNDDNPQYRGAIGVIIRSDGRLLVIERSQTVRAPGRFCFPGGGIEPGESEEDAVMRELREELDIYVEPVRRLWKSQTESGVELCWWLVKLPKDQLPTPNPEEVARYFWMDQKEIASRAETLLTNREFLAAVGTGEIDINATRNLGR